MNFKVHVSNTTEEKSWDKNLLKNKVSSIYQSTNWSKIYEKFHGSKPFFILVESPTGEIVGQLSALIHNRYYWKDAHPISKVIGPKLNLVTILQWNYGPIIHDIHNQDEILSDLVKTIDDIAIKNKVTMIRGSSSPLSAQLNSGLFGKLNYQIQHWATYITDLNNNKDGIYNKLDKKTRYDIRKSEKNQLEFEIVSKRTQLDEFEKMKVHAKKEVGERTWKNKFFDFHWKFLYEEGLERVLLVKHDGKPIGGILALIFNGNVVQHGVVNLPHTTHPLGGSFLTWNAFKWSIEMKYLTYDMGGVNPIPKSEKDKQIDFYKSKWAGKKFDYVQYVKIFDKTKLKISSILKHPTKIGRKLNHFLRTIDE